MSMHSVLENTVFPALSDRVGLASPPLGLSSVLPLEGAGSQTPGVAEHLLPIGSSVVDLRTLPAAPHGWVVTHLQAGTRLTSTGSFLWL